MSYRWGKQSKRRLENVHPLLVGLVTAALDSMDMTVQHLGGHRTEADQARLFAQRPRVTKKDGVEKKSLHQTMPSLAVDVAPWVNGAVPWKDPRPWYQMVGIIKGIAQERGIQIRCGADWDMDGDITDQKFHDLGHIELVNPQG